MQSSQRLSRFAFLVMACLLMLSAGCTSAVVPKQTITYYAPQAAWDVKVTNNAGPANEALIMLAQHDVRIMVVAQPSYNPARIWMNVHLPEGKTMRVVDDQFTIAPRDGSPSRVEKISYIRGTFVINDETIYRDLQPGDLLQGASYPTHTRFWGKPTTVNRQFEIVCPLGETLPEKFDLALPGIEISGQTINLPTLRFTRETGQFKVPSNMIHPPW
jgi:hypothetical protein